MNILYTGCHEILEYEECKLFTEIGHDVFSYQGSYMDPKGHPTLKRPGILGMKLHEDLVRLAIRPKTDLPPEIIEWADTLIVMGGITDYALVENWPRIKHKKVIWRTIGQSRSENERMLAPLRAEGLKIVRYSPKESLIPGYIGADAMIRFYKDKDDLGVWEGKDKKVINITQSLKGRARFCHYNEIMEMIAGFNAKIYGVGNDDLGALNGGRLDYDLLKGQLRDSRVFVYAGTYPAAYTLTFMEAFMAGIPIVSIGKKRSFIAGEEVFDFFEVPELIEHGITGFVADNMGELRSYIQQLLDNDELANRISQAAQLRAVSLFGKQSIRTQWKTFLAK